LGPKAETSKPTNDNLINNINRSIGFQTIFKSLYVIGILNVECR